MGCPNWHRGAQSVELRNGCLFIRKCVKLLSADEALVDKAPTHIAEPSSQLEFFCVHICYHDDTYHLLTCTSAHVLKVIVLLQGVMNHQNTSLQSRCNITSGNIYKTKFNLSSCSAEEGASCLHNTILSSHPRIHHFSITQDAWPPTFWTLLLCFARMNLDVVCNSKSRNLSASHDPGPC